MIVTFVYGNTVDILPGREWRCLPVMRSIHRLSEHGARLLDLDAFIENTPEAQQLCSDADLIVLQGNLFGPVLAAVQRWKARDKMVIVDIEDTYGPLPGESEPTVVGEAGPRQKTCAPEGCYTRLEEFRWGLRLVDGATVPSIRRQEDWRSSTNVFVLPDYLELERYLSVVPAPHEGVVIGLHVDKRNVKAIYENGLLEALQHLCAARSELKVLTWGDIPDFTAELPLPAEQKLILPGVTLNQWPGHLAYVDIGLAPLYGRFDERRSWLRVLEFMAMRIPWLASEGPPYYELRPYGWLMPNQSPAWERVLLDMIDHNQEYRAEAASEPYLYGIGQSLDENIHKVLDIYGMILNRNYIGGDRFP
ncbi:MAG: glycosyltransferase family 4 protein [Chloroflexi bacterium]|jgi:hypothetical protein|nr:hypothetical protein [Anaerolineaceae bacterium]NMB90541.1 glycosyltransferase family 4 protein [Chloroflexota bacterium]